MKIIIILGTIIVCTFARPGIVGYSGAVLAPLIGPIVVPSSLSSQYHAQDELGQYAYGYSDVLSTKNELKTFDGVTRGGYSYLDANGIVQSVQYVADPVNGFRVAATNLPIAPKAEPVEPAAPLEAPQPVEDTPEVAQEKEKHLAAVEEAKARNAAAEAETETETESESSQDNEAAAAPLAVAYSLSAPTLAYAISPIAPLVYDSPDVAVAKVQHLAAHLEARARLAAAQ